MARPPRAVDLAGRVALAGCLAAAGAAGQESQATDLLQDPRKDLEGLEVRRLSISGTSSSEAVRRMLAPHEDIRPHVGATSSLVP